MLRGLGALRRFGAAFRGSALLKGSERRALLERGERDAKRMRRGGLVRGREELALRWR
jgi:hypothetical protein